MLEPSREDGFVGEQIRSVYLLIYFLFLLASYHYVQNQSSLDAVFQVRLEHHWTCCPDASCVSCAGLEPAPFPDTHDRTLAGTVSEHPVVICLTCGPALNFGARFLIPREVQTFRVSDSSSWPRIPVLSWHGPRRSWLVQQSAPGREPGPSPANRAPGRSNICVHEGP